MLTRAELLSKIKDNVAESMNLIYASVSWMFPSVDAEGKEAFSERFGIAEHMIKKLFVQPSAKRNPVATLANFCEILSFDEKDVELAVQNACEDLETDNPPLDEIATTAVFLWFSKAMRENGDFDPEFKFLCYALSDSQRGNSQLKEAGLNNLYKKLQSDGNFFTNLACFCRKVLNRF